MSRSNLAPQARLWLNDRNAAQGYIQLPDKRISLIGIKMPHNALAERAIIANLLHQSAQGDIQASLAQTGFLDALDFHLWVYGTLFAAIVRLQRQGQAVDVVSLLNLLSSKSNDDGKTVLDQVGGEPFIFALLAEPAMSIAECARIVREQAAKRQALFDIEQMRLKGETLEAGRLADLLAELNATTQRLQAQLLALNPDNGFVMNGEIGAHMAQVRYEQLHPEAVEYMSSGFSSLDELITGWGKRRLYLVGGANGMGKSAFLLSTGIAALRQNKKVCFVSLELSKQELLERIACAVGQIDSRRMTRRSMSADELGRLDVLVSELEQMAADGGQMRMICLPQKPTLDELTNEIEKVYQTGGFDLLVIDYVGWGRFSEADPNFRGGNTVAFSGAIFSRVDSYKTRYNCPVLVAVQINRDHERNRDKRPELRNIADSKIGGDNADVVLFVHRPDALEGAENEVVGRAELLVRKVRNGGTTGTAYIKAELEYNRFNEWREGRVDLSDL